ncbi:MAG: FecR domain-containing protein [Bacteroidales bacterium]
MDEKIWEIISSKLNNQPLSAEDLSVLEQWLNANADNLNFYSRMHTFYKGQNVRSNIDVQTAFVKVKGGVSMRKTARFKRILWSGISAAAIVIAGLFLFLPKEDKAHHILFTANVLEDSQHINEVLFKPAGGSHVVLNKKDSAGCRIAGINLLANNSKGVLYCSADYHVARNPSHRNIIKTPIGKDYKVVLSDGTQIWLNSDSYLSFPSVFDKKERRVKLQGEALFKVTKSSAENEQPFIVETGNMDIKVLGTYFDVKAYKDDDNVYTTLIEGAVRVVAQGMSQEQGVDLLPCEQYALNVHTGKQIVKEVDPYLYMAWAEEMFVFKNQRLEDVMKDLSRWYRIEYSFADMEAAGIRISGNIEKLKGMDEIVQMILKLNKTNINKAGGKYIISTR